MIEDNYLEKSLNNEKIIKERLNKIKKKYPKLILETRGSGSLHGILFNPGELKKFINIIYKVSPISFLKDDQAIYKIICASVIFYLYKKFNILTYYGSNLGIPLKVSPSIIVSKDEINLFFDCLEKTLDKGFLRLVVGFLKSKIFTKIKFL